MSYYADLIISHEHPRTVDELTLWRLDRWLTMERLKQTCGKKGRTLDAAEDEEATNG